MHPEPIGEAEIAAYLDDELDLDRRFAVECYLHAHPDAAAQVMGDLRLATALRMAQPVLARDRGLEAIADRLGDERSPTHRVRKLLSMPRLTLVAACAALVIVLSNVTPQRIEAKPPAYVSDAVMSYQTGLVRAGMTSQPESVVFDSRDWQRSTRIRVPVLPDGWKVTDVQLFPSDEGPALHIMAHTPGHKVVSIFAVRTAEAAPRKPVALRRGGTSVAYWRNDDMAYALTGVGEPEALDLAAEDLADNHFD